MSDRARAAIRLVPAAARGLALLLSLALPCLVPVAPSHAAISTALPAAPGAARVMAGPEPGPEIDPGIDPGPDLRSQLQDAEPAEAARILRDYARRKGIPLDERPPMPPRPDFSIRLPAGAFTPAPGVEAGLLVPDDTRELARARALVPDVTRALSPGAEVALLLQLNARPSLGELIELYELGLKGLADDIPNYAHAVLAPAASLAALSARPYVRWLGEYRPEFKYRAYDPAAPGNGRAFVYPIDGDRPPYRAGLAALGVTVERYDGRGRFYYARVDEARLAGVAALPWVRWIERDSGEELLQAGVAFEPDDSRELVCAFDSGRNGAGVVVGVRDNGLYTGHADFAGRIHPLSDTVNGDHGTHVTGIILGGGTIDLAGDYDARGVAPGASVFFRSSAPDYAVAFADFAANGVQLSNHSWAFTTGTYDYDSRTRAIDDYADDEEMIVVVAAGNSGPAANTITNPATGRNVISVGAVRYLTDDALPGRVLGGVTDNSSRGPTLGSGRLKPDLVAPGGQEWGDYAEWRHGVVSCNDDPDGVATGVEWPEDDRYDRMSGTSMAAPHVTGALAQMLQSHPGLSAEAAKARLIGGTIPLKTSSGAEPRNAYANTVAGYGLLNTFHAAGYNYCPASAQTLKWLNGQVDYANDHDEHTFTVPAGADQLVAVVAYDDETFDDTGDLGDDVDLSLEDDLGALYTYALPSGVTAEGTVEKMIVESPRAGTWTALIDFGPRDVSSLQHYSLYILAIVDKPALGLAASLPHANPYLPGEAFSLAVTAQNTGGWIAAGVTAQVDWALAGLPNTTRFVDSLVCEDASRSINVGLQAPADWGTYNFTLILDGLNRGLSSVGQPFSINVCDQVTLPSPMLPANGDSTCDATPTFEWSALTGAPSYRLQVDDDSGFGSPAINVWPVASYSYTLGSALPAGYYYWRLRGESAACQGRWSAVRSLTVLAAPAAPALSYPASGGEICGSSPYFSWTGVSGATLYQIQVDNNSDFGSREIDQTTASTSYTHGAALPVGTYYWRVRSYNSCGWGGWSSTRSFVSSAVTPSPPSLVSPGYGEDTCDRTPTLVWSAVPGAESYHIQVDDDSDWSSPEVDYGIYGTEYTPSTALPLDRHYWRVQSYNSCGYGSWSQTGRVDVVDVPPVPTLVIPADDSDQCNTNLGFQWSSQWATSYRLRVDNDPQFTSPEIAVTTSAPHYEVGETLAPKTYYWRVWASNACGDSGWSAERSFDLMEAPAAPTLSAPIGWVVCDTTPTFWWNLDTWGDKQFRLQVDDDPFFVSLALNATTTDYAYTPGSPLAAPKTWYWRVNAENACGTGAWSPYASFAIATAAPATPSLAAPGDGSELCDMTPAFDWSSVSWADSYRIMVDDDAGWGSPEIDQTVSGSDYTPGTALPAGAYYWRAQACNGCGCGAWSSARALIVLETPYTPALIRPTDGSKTGDDTPYFFWTPVTADEYRLQVDDDAGFGSLALNATTTDSWFIPATPLANGAYYWRVQASNATCASGWSNVFQLTVDTTCPTPPVPSLTAPPYGTRICDPTPTFQWTAASGATFYQIQIDDQADLGSPLIDTTVAGPSFTPDTPLAGHIYYWRVRACNGCGCDSWTQTRHFWVIFDPVAPSLVTPADGSVTCDTTPGLNWDPVDVASRYELELDNDPGFGSPVITVTLVSDYLGVGEALAADTYYWHVRSCNDCDCGAWSPAWSVTIGPPGPAPALASPANGARLCTATPGFAWSPVSGTASYRLQVDTDPGFPLPFIDATTPATGYLSLEPLPLGTSYWRVQAGNTCGSSDWSAAWTVIHADCAYVHLPLVLKAGP